MENNRQSFINVLRKNAIVKEDIDLIMYAYDLAKSAHRNQQRDDGQRYFEHARECALILINELGITDPNKIIAMLLHDTGEDTSMFGNIVDSYEEFRRTAEFRLRLTFNGSVAKYVIFLSKPHVDGIYFKNKGVMMDLYITNLEDEPDIFVLKMIDRLHNLRSLKTGTPEKIEKQVKETNEVLLPAFQRSISRYLKPVPEAPYKLLHLIEHELNLLDKVLA